MRLRLLAACGLAFGLITTIVAQEKKEPPAPAKKAEGKAPDAKAPDAKAPDAKAAPAGDNPLAWKFVKDQPFWQEMTTKTIQNIRVQGLEVGQNQEQTFYF